MTQKLVCLVAVLGMLFAVAVLAGSAYAHYPSESYSESRVFNTNYGGACGSITWYCYSRLWADCGGLWGSHSRSCHGEFREFGIIRTRFCSWQGRVEHYGNVVTHSKGCN